MDEIKFELREADLAHPALHNAMLLVVEYNGIYKPIGTAVSVVPGLAFTASHVVNPERWGTNENTNQKPSFVALQFYDDKFWPWSVESIYGSVSYDIAVLTLRKPDWWETAPEELRVKFPRLNFNPPQPGDEVQVFGFPETEFENGIFYIKPSQCSAVVESVEHHCENSDIARSHVKLRGQLLNGMSGGPCFDKDFNLVGINQGGFSFRYEVYVALLWSAMRFEIDLFKTGAFPVIELFNQGPARALGYRRVQVTSDRRALISKVDPESLQRIWFQDTPENMESAVNFAALNAQSALVELQVHLDGVLNNSQPLDVNAVCRCIRRYFWELESALVIAIQLAAIHLNIKADHPLSWDEMRDELRARGGVPNRLLDELTALDVRWYGLDLFDVRTYAELSRSTVPHLTCGKNDERTIAVVLNPGRRGGPQLVLPEGLEQFFTSAKNFVQRLLRAAEQDSAILKDNATSLENEKTYHNDPKGRSGV